ncbi:Fe-S cluster assembly ATPase SufC [Enterobacteriaceae endosymbiont of Neohaemonia nigricornis]|uniref:Fe-S cluster assembly ATPase SufC n=1 Tax=Enterobacteriaceae endosymbiont of Neohaemonia nigricornis TaxID=2675792 RepID=UPI001448E919|nr:Fe-S cluster assembly ATPase SufC [Enterobacteriaceae endosymbiont of Neohaemonia nigricornis]QJC30535.1 Fe-S cluster assembly ATPase SufC [Enterobacteriaceae endosymbiont of Neohaemonia nigricornis]
MLIIKNLYVNINKKNIIKNLNLHIKPGKIHVIMGPNGSGKSTLSYVLAGHSSYIIPQGQILYKNQDLLNMKPEIRACEGLFVAFQHSPDIPGVTNYIFLYNALNSIRKYKNLKLIDRFIFKDIINNNLKIIGKSKAFIQRFVNVGFSGGEKKINDILQMLVLEPNLCILDEIDSGLDIDALKKVATIINSMRNKKRSFIIITHYQRILNYIKPDYVHILNNNTIIKSGDIGLVSCLEDHGYDNIHR